MFNCISLTHTICCKCNAIRNCFEHLLVERYELRYTISKLISFHEWFDIGIDDIYCVATVDYYIMEMSYWQIISYGYGLECVWDAQDTRHKYKAVELRREHHHAAVHVKFK